MFCVPVPVSDICSLLSCEIYSKMKTNLRTKLEHLEMGTNNYLQKDYTPSLYHSSEIASSKCCPHCTENIKKSFQQEGKKGQYQNRIKRTN